MPQDLGSEGLGSLSVSFRGGDGSPTIPRTQPPVLSFCHHVALAAATLEPRGPQPSNADEAPGIPSSAKCCMSGRPFPSPTNHLGPKYGLRFHHAPLPASGRLQARSNLVSGYHRDHARRSPALFGCAWLKGVNESSLRGLRTVGRSPQVSTLGELPHVRPSFPCNPVTQGDFSAHHSSSTCSPSQSICIS